jgi:hypothetical protein
MVFGHSRCCNGECLLSGGLRFEDQRLGYRAVNMETDTYEKSATDVVDLPAQKFCYRHHR